MKAVYFDIMLRGRYLFTVRYKPVIPNHINFNDVMQLAYRQRPSLRNEPIKIARCY